MKLRSNTKLGSCIAGFSIPAITTCPGRSKLCEAACYATYGHFTTSTVQNALSRNYQATTKSDFVHRMFRVLQQTPQPVIRIHVSGDFDRVDYIRQWIWLVQRCRHKIFLAYTRSWRVKRLRRTLNRLARQPNMRLWLSTDQELHKRFGRPPRWKDVRIAYMATSPDGQIPGYVDLVFRTYRKGVQKFMDSKLVCPAENGVRGKLKMTCSTCKLCWSDRPIPSKERIHHASTDPQERTKH